MDRRTFLISTVGGTPILAGCTGSGNDPGGDESSNGDGTGAAPSEEDTPEDGTETESEPDYDVAIDYSTHVQSSAFGEYDLPDPQYDDWSWLVVDIDVREGQLDMADLWFNGFFETEERLYDVAHDSSDVVAGVESRGVIRQGGRGVVLHDYPPTPRGEVVDLSHSSTHAERGIRSRGMVKPGYSANALYLIDEQESVEEWGYTEDGRQDASISRV